MTSVLGEGQEARCALLTAHSYTPPPRGATSSLASRKAARRNVLAEHAACRNRAYADHVGCSFSSIINSNVNASLHPSWHKIPLLLKSIDAARDRPILWLDSDAVVQDTSRPPDEWIHSVWVREIARRAQQTIGRWIETKAGLRSVSLSLSASLARA